MYDLQTLLQWFNEDIQKLVISQYGENIDDNVMKLYKAYIYLSCVLNNGSFQKETLRTMEYHIIKYPPMYDSLIMTSHMKENNLCKKLKECCTRKKIILVQGGSFNPVHKNHINNLNKARKFIQDDFYHNENEYCIKCIVVPADDQRIRSKCKNGISLYHRYQMLRLVCDDIMIDLSQISGRELVQNYMNIFGDVEIIVVVGSDSLDYNYKIYPDTTKFIVISRKDYNVEDEEKIHNCSRIMYLSDDEIKMSSTIVRNFPKDNNKVLQYIDENVRDYYKKI